MMLLALPAGVLADAFDRGALMLGVQVYFVIVATLLAVKGHATGSRHWGASHEA
ncbi:MFS transporter [Pseudarthrobacter sp. MDT3-28]|nr:MFS transporter [Pseudarthrobacter sp. MDT3-28]